MGKELPTLSPTETARFYDTLVRTASGCLECKTTDVNSKGYGRFRVQREGRTRHLLAHRLAFKLAYGRLPNELCVLHSCDNPPCCEPDHLRLGTHVENMREAKTKGRLNVELTSWHEEQSRRARSAHPPGFRRCSECCEVKPLEEFHRHKRDWAGRCTRCKECAKAIARAHYAARVSR